MIKCQNAGFLPAPISAALCWSHRGGVATMTPETYPPLAALLRGTLFLVKSDSAAHAHRPEFAVLTTALLRTIAAMNA
jgi:hypothetical protein